MVIQLEVDTGEKNGWQGEERYGSRYKLYKEGKNWGDAKALCQGEGGHLASVTTAEKWQEVEALASGYPNGVHLGRSDKEEDGGLELVRLVNVPGSTQSGIRLQAIVGLMLLGAGETASTAFKYTKKYGGTICARMLFPLFASKMTISLL